VAGRRDNAARPLAGREGVEPCRGLGFSLGASLSASPPLQRAHRHVAEELVTGRLRIRLEELATELQDRLKVALGEDIYSRPKLVGTPSEGRTGDSVARSSSRRRRRTTTESTTVNTQDGPRTNGRPEVKFLDLLP
jgi:hypothetical protein